MSVIFKIFDFIATYLVTNCRDDPNRRRYFTTRFEMTLIKLHLWNQTAYERLLYMDADCIVLHPVQELFHCGHFCAVYMNVVAFHTGETHYLVYFGSGDGCKT